MKLQEEKVRSIVWIILAFLLFLSSLFIIYANETILDKNDNKTRIQKKIYYSKLYFWDYLEKISDYKNSIVIENKDSETMTKWIVRIISILWLWFASSLFLLQIFPEKEKEFLVKKSFLYSFWIVFLLVIILKIYLFYLSWWFNFDFSWFFKKPDWWWLSFFEKLFIILIIILVFIWVWVLYNKKEKKDE